MLKKLFIRPLTVRVLPLTLVAALVMLTVKLGDVWTGFRNFDQQFTLRNAEAIAQEAKPNESAPVEGQQMAQANKAQLPVGDPSRFRQEEIDLLQALAERRQQIDRRSEELRQREEILRAAEQRFEQKVAELESMRAQLEQLLSRQNDAEDSRLRGLVKIYETMKPTDAARIFNELQIEVLMGVAERMKENKLAPVLAAMNADRAKRVTEMLAERQQPGSGQVSQAPFQGQGQGQGLAPNAPGTAPRR